MNDEQTSRFLAAAGECFDKLEENLAKTDAALDQLAAGGPLTERGETILRLLSQQLASLRIALQQVGDKLTGLADSADASPPNAP